MIIDNILRTLTTTNYLVVNKTLIQHFGTETAIFLSNLIDKYFYFKEHKMLKKGDGFFVIYENQIKQTGLGLKKLRRCKKQLINEKIITTRMLGTPAKEYYFIDFETLLTRINTSPTDLVRSSPTDLVRSSPTDLVRSYNNNKDNNNKVLKYYFVEEADFKNFWKLYPRKDGKGSALKAWINLCKSESKKKYRPTWSQVAKAITLQKRSERWGEPKFIPLPTTWINQYRWLDDPGEMKLYTKEQPYEQNEQDMQNNIPEYLTK